MDSDNVSMAMLGQITVKGHKNSDVPQVFAMLHRWAHSTVKVKNGWKFV